MSRKALFSGIVSVAVLIAVIAVPHQSVALAPEEQLSDPVAEARARELAQGLRCLVCQNQTVDDSDTDFATSMRRLIRDHIRDNKSDDEIINYLSERYGDYILLSPPINGLTIWLWVAPVVLLLAGLGVILATRPKRRDSEGGSP